MAHRAIARADRRPSAHRRTPFRVSWFWTWAGDDTGRRVQQTVLKSARCQAILIVGSTSVVPILTSNFTFRLATRQGVPISLLACAPNVVINRRDEMKRLA